MTTIDIIYHYLSFSKIYRKNNINPFLLNIRHINHSWSQTFFTLKFINYQNHDIEKLTNHIYEPSFISYIIKTNSYKKITNELLFLEVIKYLHKIIKLSLTDFREDYKIFSHACGYGFLNVIKYLHND